jgi:hypothetical protein
MSIMARLPDEMRQHVDPSLQGAAQPHIGFRGGIGLVYINLLLLVALRNTPGSGGSNEAKAFGKAARTQLHALR